MINLETITTIPVVGIAFTFLYRKVNNKISRKECLRVHESLDKRLEMMHDDIKFIKERIIK